MPPRIPSLRRTFRFIVSPTVDSKSSLFLPFLLPQARNASILADLRDNTKAYSHKIKRGRGPSSGRGKTSGRGQKGQKAHGKVPSGFQGGQTPVEVVAGKRGFDNQFSVNMSKVNLDTIQSWIDQGRLDPSRPITLKELVKSRCIHGIKDGVKLLGRNSTELKTPIKVLVSRASASAIAAVEANGGSVTTRYYSPLAIKRVLKGDSPSEAFEPGPLPLDPQYKFRLPDPTSRKDIEYYRDPAHRGYLSHLVGEGETPSLFFRTPGKGKIATKKSVAAKAENRIW